MLWGRNMHKDTYRAYSMISCSLGCGTSSMTGNEGIGDGGGEETEGALSQEFSTRSCICWVWIEIAQAS